MTGLTFDKLKKGLEMIKDNDVPIDSLRLKCNCCEKVFIAPKGKASKEYADWVNHVNKWLDGEPASKEYADWVNHVNKWLDGEPDACKQKR